MSKSRDEMFGALSKLFECGYWRICRNYMGMEFALVLHSDRYNFCFEIELGDEVVQKILAELYESLNEHKQELEKLIGWESKIFEAPGRPDEVLAPKLEE